MANIPTDLKYSTDHEWVRIDGDPYGDGWLVKVHFTGTPDGLLSAAEYEAYVQEETAD